MATDNSIQYIDIFKGKGLTGLHNLGNTCYINTLLQCLGHCTTSFLVFMLKGTSAQHVQHAQDAQHAQDGIFYQLRCMYRDQWINTTTPDPRKLLKTLSQKLTLFDNIYEQNDINEFMDYFLDKMNSEICSPRQGLPLDTLTTSSNKRSIYHQQAKKMMHDWYFKTQKEHSELVEMIYGQSINQIICGHCRKIHHNYEIYSHIMLPVINGDHDISLHDCFKKYLEDEVINADIESSNSDPWKCDKCNKCSKSSKSFVLWNTPRLLMISLKRFNSDMRKINKPVQIPHVLDVSDYVISHNCPRTYNLCSVALHYGSFLGGHYVAACRNPNNEWYIFDDDVVQKLADPDRMISQGYVFFYEAQPDGAGATPSIS